MILSERQKKLKVYTRREEVVTKIVRRSAHLNKSTKKFELVSMKGIFWNSDGLKDLTKHRFVHETIVEHKLDFYTILEMGRDNFSTPFLNNTSGGQDFQWYCLPPMGR
jgi:hypothetical protein